MKKNTPFSLVLMMNIYADSNMKEIKLTRGQIALVDDEDYEYLMQRKWYAQYFKSSRGFYAVRALWVDGKTKSILMHRAIMNATDPKIKVDHIDHNGLNNCRGNLRLATHAQNLSNRVSHRNSSSKYVGVSWCKLKKRWRASIGKNNKHFGLGYFIIETDAAKAYDKKAKELHGEFANLNFKGA